MVYQQGDTRPHKRESRPYNGGRLTVPNLDVRNGLNIIDELKPQLWFPDSRPQLPLLLCQGSD